MGTSTIENTTSEQVLTELAAVITEMKASEPEEPKARKVVPLSEIQNMLEAVIPSLRGNLEQAITDTNAIMDFMTTSRMAGDVGMFERLSLWRDTGFGSIIEDFAIFLTELQTWENTVKLEVENRDLKKQIAAFAAAEKKSVKAANAAMVTGDKPAAKSAPAVADEAAKPEQRRNRKAEAKAEEPVAA